MSSPVERRSPFLRLLDAFFQEDNIKWVLGLGVTILLGSSIRLVTLHWQEYTPVWKYLILLGYTVAVFGLGELSYHRMALRKTGTVLMSLTVLLIPISFLALKAIDHERLSKVPDVHGAVAPSQPPVAALHWIHSEATAIDDLRHMGLSTLLAINLAWSAFAANHIFRHFLRATQPTFLVCYLILCVAGAIVPGLPTAWSQWLALAMWAAFAAGTVKVNRHVFWLTEEYRLPRIFGFFPILLLGSQFAVVFIVGIAGHLSFAWMGLLCTLVSLPILLTANAVARVFERRTGGLVRPIPWSISGPLFLGICLSAAGVILAITGWPASGAIVPTAMLASVAMGVIAHRTQKSAFVWSLVFCVVIAYQTSPVFFKELVLQLRDQAASAVRESRLPYAFYGLTYAPLIAVFSIVAAILRSRGGTLFAFPLRVTATALSCLLLAAAFTHPTAILPVALLLCPMFAMQAFLFQRQQYLIPAAVSFLSAAYGAVPFVERIWEWNVSPESALLVWVVAAALLLLPGTLIDRWACTLNRADDGPTPFAMNHICQLFSLAGAIAAAGVWCVRFGSSINVADIGSGSLAAGCITALLAIHALRWLRPGLGELTLSFATIAFELHFVQAGLSSAATLENVCGILLVQWGFSDLLARAPTTRVARAFGAATYRISFSGLSVLFVWFVGVWTARHFGVENETRTISLLMMLWGLDASRRTASWPLSTIAWGSLFVYVSAMITEWLGLVEAQSWWMLAWVVTGLVLLAVRQIVLRRADFKIVENNGTPFGPHFWPERPSHISPRQSGAPPWEDREGNDQALLGATQYRNIHGIMSPTGLGTLSDRNPGRRSAAFAATLCPGLICDGLSGQRKTAGCDGGQQAIWLAPLGVLLPLVFAVVGTVSLLSLDWLQRMSGALALFGLFAARRHRLPLNLFGLFPVLLNWQMAAALTSVLLQTTGLVFHLSSNDLADCGLPLAAFAMISVWCFESRLRNTVANGQLVVSHQLLLLCLAGILLLAAIPSNMGEAWTAVSIAWAAIAWSGAISAALTCAVRTQNRHWVWLGEAALAGSIVYFNVAGVLNPTATVTAYLAVFAGLLMWSFGCWTESRTRLAVLSQPLQQTGYWLPMSVLPLAVLTQLNDATTVWAGANSMPLLCAAAFYFWRGMEQHQLGTALLSAIMVNVACLFLWKDLNWSDPQLFLMPIGICILILTELMNREIPAAYHGRLRFIGALVILVSPVFHIVTGSWLHILTLMVASAALALLAIGLRIRVLLYTSTAFLLADLVALVARGSIDEPSVLWIVGVLLGASMIALGAACENHRETMLARLRGLAAELEQWPGTGTGTAGSCASSSGSEWESRLRVEENIPVQAIGQVLPNAGNDFPAGATGVRPHSPVLLLNGDRNAV